MDKHLDLFPEWEKDHQEQLEKERYYKYEKDLSDTVKDEYKMLIECSSEKDQKEIFNIINERFNQCKILIL